MTTGAVTAQAYFKRFANDEVGGIIIILTIPELKLLLFLFTRKLPEISQALVFSIRSNSS